MATYQNIFTQVQVQGPPEMGVPHLDGSEERLPFTTHNYWMGKLGRHSSARSISASPGSSASPSGRWRS